ncbi:MAG: NACHT domain-containing NTPase, partial [Spirulina sp.]
RPKSEKILLQQVGVEIASRLRQSLHNQIFINLAKESQPQQVKRPWDYEVKVGSKDKEKLSSDTAIIAVFDRSDIGGRLLILGKPGSGKTTTMLDLAKELLERAQDPKEPIPVLFGLSSWASKPQSIPEWLVEELKSKYGVHADIGKKWLQEQKFLPLLDGLDEVKSDRQRACVEALNRWIAGDDEDYSSPGQFVVCSRIEEYEQLGTRLQMNGAICLTELSDRQIRVYLESVERSHLWNLIDNNETLRDLVRAPLFLSMIVFVDSKELQNLQESDDVQSLLIDLYIRRMLQRLESEREELKREKKRRLSKEKRKRLNQRIERLGSYSSRQMRLWLVWLAKQMEIEKQTEFLVEKMQPSWLRSKKLERSYRWQVPIIAGLGGGLIFGVNFWLIYTVIVGVIGVISVGVIGVITGQHPIGWLLESLMVGRILGLNAALIVGVIVGVIVGLRFGFNTCLKHFVLRQVLHANGFAPWSYARFLTSCSDCLLLQQVGGRFRFIHKTVQEHFAAMDFEKP